MDASNDLLSYLARVCRASVLVSSKKIAFHTLIAMDNLITTGWAAQFPYRRDNPLGGIKLAAPRLILQPDQARIMQPTSAHALRPERRLLMVWSVYAGAMINRYLPVVPTRWCTHMGSYPSFYWVQLIEPDPQRAGRPFDKDRDGFVMGEGGAFSYLNQQKLRAKVEKLGMLLPKAAAMPITSRPRI